MKIYKVVPCQGRIVVKPNEKLDASFIAINDVITQETMGGWELVSVMPITVALKKNRKRTYDEPYNALIFSKDAAEQKTEE